MKGQVCEAIEISKEVDSRSPELFKSVCSLRCDKDMYSERKKTGTYSSDNPAVLNHIAKHMKAYVLLVLSHLFRTSWKEMITKQKIEYGTSCMCGCFSEFAIHHLPYKVYHTKGSSLRSYVTRNTELTEGC